MTYVMPCIDCILLPLAGKLQRVFRDGVASPHMHVPLGDERKWWAVNGSEYRTARSGLNLTFVWSLKVFVLPENLPCSMR